MNQAVPQGASPTQNPEETVFQQPTTGFLPQEGATAVPTFQPDTEPVMPARPTPEPAPQVARPEQSASRQTTQTAPVPTREEAFAEDETFPDYSSYFSGVPKPMPEELLYEWRADSRPFKKHTRSYYTTIGVIVLLVSLILVFAGQFLPMAVVCAVAFMAYVLNSVPPQEIQYQITTYGVRMGEKLYYWNAMTRFWYSDKYGQELLNIEIVQFPDRLTLVLKDAQKEVLTSILSEVLLLQRPALTTYERIAEWLQEKFPLDLDS